MERVKSAVLFFLVLLSMVLTYQLWFGRRSAEEAAPNGYEPVYFEEPKPLSQLLIPRSILFYRDNLCYRLRPGEAGFERFWEALSQILQEMDQPANYEYGEALPEGAALCLSLEFDPPLPLGPESAWLKDAPRGELAGMKIWREGERCWAVLLAGGQEGRPLLLPLQRGAQMAALCEKFTPPESALCELLEAGELKLPQGRAVTVNVPLCVPAGEGAMVELLLKAEVLDRELLLNTFFINRSLVREIRERDGGLIYTDGEQGLRLYQGLEYSRPRIEQKAVLLSYPAALQAAGKLLSYYGGWPEKLRLESLVPLAEEESRPGEIWSARWRSYLQGYPLLGEAEVAMVYHQGGMVHYRRKLYEAPYSQGEALVLRGCREALAAAVDLLAAAGVEEYFLEEMELAYYLTGSSYQPRAVPVWAIRMSGRELILNAHSLLPLEGGER
ncbi:MAG: hypothetical protein GX890_04110 [Firmicutes bacterium]|nr:hypothetical protein [Bacillota bacterium]HPU00579.1 two-component system activity regulator YycH [Bacillota bacterium]